MLADDMSDINRRLRAIRAEEKRPDDDWNTAGGADLDALAAARGIRRVGIETDYSLRSRLKETAIWR